MEDSLLQLFHSYPVTTVPDTQATEKKRIARSVVNRKTQRSSNKYGYFSLNKSPRYLVQYAAHADTSKQFADPLRMKTLVRAVAYNFGMRWLNGLEYGLYLPEIG